MGLFDKVKDAAGKAAEAAKTGAANAKQAFDEKNARANAAAIERENEGLSPEEIIAKDEAKKIITFNRLKIAAYLQFTDGKEFWSDAKNVGKTCAKDASNKRQVATYYDEPRFRLKFKNESDRRMKYVHLDIDGINAVGDIAETECFKSTGPFEPGKTYSRNWTDAAFKSSVREINVKKITIQFFDGDDVVLEGKWLDRLINEGIGSGLMNFAKA